MKRYDYLCESVAFASTLMQTQQVLQIIQFLITIIATLFSLYISFRHWKDKALKDGKIEHDELEEIKGEIMHGLDEIKKEIDKHKGGE